MQKIDYSNAKATIESIVEHHLRDHGLTWAEMRGGEITQTHKDCLQQITLASLLTEQNMIAAYTNISLGRLQTIASRKIKISVYE